MSVGGCVWEVKCSCAVAQTAGRPRLCGEVGGARGTAHEHGLRPPRSPSPHPPTFASPHTPPARAQVWHEAGALVGEPTFVPGPGADALEDEGVVLACMAQRDGTAALLFLDGRTHQEVARAALPFPLTTGFHGGFAARPGGSGGGAAA